MIGRESLCLGREACGSEVAEGSQVKGRIRIMSIEGNEFSEKMCCALGKDSNALSQIAGPFTFY